MHCLAPFHDPPNIKKVISGLTNLSVTGFQV